MIFHFPLWGHICATQHLKERTTDSASIQSPPTPPPSQCPMHQCKGARPHTLSELYSCSLAWRAGGGKTQMRAESLCRAVSQTLVETQELMNAARSQSVAQQLQLHSKCYLSEGNRQEWRTKYSKWRGSCLCYCKKEIISHVHAKECLQIAMCVFLCCCCLFRVCVM